MFDTPCRPNRTPVSRGRAFAIGAAIAAGVTGAGCASIRVTSAGAADPGAKTYEVAITRTAVIAAPPDEVFAFIAAEDVLPKVLTGYGPLPAVVGTSANTGPWDRPGSARLVHLADDTTAREQLTHHAAPTAFAYRVWDFGNPVVNSLATQARGEWEFEAVAGGTKVTWTYTFTARNAAAALPLSGITAVLWRGYMDVCLENTERLLVPSHGASQS